MRRMRKCGGSVDEGTANGISWIWRRSSDDSLEQTGHDVLLLLGNFSNAMAAIDQRVPDVRVTHVVSVCESHLILSLSQRALTSTHGVKVLPFSMADRLAAEEEMSFDDDLKPPLDALTNAVDEAARMEFDSESSESSLPRAVLVHCKLGYNRSPTLVLGYLVSRGLTLRDAYRLVLRERSFVDPLPTYRRALRDLEMREQKERSVTEVDLFGKHISELFAYLEKDECDGCVGMQEVIRARDADLRALQGLPPLEETCRDRKLSLYSSTHSTNPYCGSTRSSRMSQSSNDSSNSDVSVECEPFSPSSQNQRVTVIESDVSDDDTERSSRDTLVFAPVLAA